MNTNKLVAILIILVSIIGVSMLFNHLTEETKEVKPVEIKSTFSNTEIYKNFMRGCIDDDPTMFTQCDCMINYLHKEIGSDGILRMSLEYIETEEFSDPMIDAVVACTY